MTILAYTAVTFISFQIFKQGDPSANPVVKGPSIYDMIKYTRISKNLITI